MASLSGQSAAPRSLVAANWKMNGLRRDGLDLARALARSAGEAGGLLCDVVICPPATLLAELREALDGSGLALGAQDCHVEPVGAFTGDISAPMLSDVGCRYVILGHSERRTGHGETDGLVNAKARAAQGEGLIAIICIGESHAERDAGHTLDVIREQLMGSVPADAHTDNTVIAYEPVWAIGTGRTPTLTQIEEVHRHVRDLWSARFSDGAAGLRVLYGGSVKATNAVEIFSVAGVSGALVGGASLSAEGFWAICQAAR